MNFPDEINAKDYEERIQTILHSRYQYDRNNKI